MSSVFCKDCGHDANHHFSGGKCSYCKCERNPLQVLLDRITELEASSTTGAVDSASADVEDEIPYGLSFRETEF